MAKKNIPMNLEKSLQELEALVLKLEQGDLPLEESLQHFERGVQLTRVCQQALSDAEQKIDILLGDTPQPCVLDSVPAPQEKADGAG